MLKLDKINILKMAVPIMLGTFIQNIIMITDAIFLNRLGTIAFDAANNAGLLYIIFFMISKGLGDGSQIQIAKEFGQKNYLAIKSSLSHSFFLQLIITSTLIIFGFIFIQSIIPLIVANKEIGINMGAFLKFRIWGLFFAGFQVALISFFIGIGQTKIIIYSSLILAFLNIALDYGLIFGNFGLPELGIEGAALASTISEGIAFVFTLAYLIKSNLLSKYQLNKPFTFLSNKTIVLLKLSWPLMLSGFLSISTWFVFFTFIEQRSPIDLEVSHVVRNLFFISFIPIFGFSAVTRTYISFYHGIKDFSNIKKARKNILLLSMFFYLVFFHGAIFYPELMIRLITSNETIIIKSIPVLRNIFGSMFLFSIVAVYYSSVTAIGKTFIALLIEVIAIFIYLIAAYYIVIKWNWEIKNVWLIEYLYFGLLGILSIGYIIFNNYKQNKKYV